MLLELSIQNIALIDKMSVTFNSGMNVLTGETGAGKSIVVDSVNLALGQRADRDLIRTGTEKALVQAVFCPKNNSKLDFVLSENGIELDDGLLYVSRELSTSGRNVCRVNGVMVPLATLKIICSFIVDLHGQHEHQSLMDQKRHIDYLDAFGGEKHFQLLYEVKATYAQAKAAASALKKASASIRSREQRIDMLKYQDNEIKSAKLKINEDIQLEKQIKLMQNAERIASSIKVAYNLLYSGTEKAMSVRDSIKTAIRELSSIMNIDEKYGELKGKLDEAFYFVEDVSYELRDSGDELEFDPKAMEKAENRLDTIQKLIRKYGPTVEDVIAYQVEIEKELSSIESFEDEIKRLTSESKCARVKLEEACTNLSESRRDLGVQFSSEMLVQLRDLGMGRSRFEVEIHQSESYTSLGRDYVEFMISPNPGEALKPLQRIASGGELSRLMLALKVIAADKDSISCMIFDEIDAGISGKMAQVVGEKMAIISGNRQVICVTHLPQIAALCDAHYLVEKTQYEDRTGTSLRLLSDQERQQEISRMISGEDAGATGISHAQNMLLSADSKKNLLRDKIMI